MSEMTQALRMLSAEMPTCIQRIKNPGTPYDGLYFMVGRIPYDCTKESGGLLPGRKSKHYQTEQEAIDAAIAAGATRIQRADCSFVEGFK